MKLKHRSLISALLVAGTVTVGSVGGLAQQNGGVSVQGPFAEVDRLFRSRQFDAAKELLNDLSVSGSEGVQKYLWLSRLHLEQGAGIAAETAIERARELGADYALTAVPFAKAMLVQGKYSDALAAMRGVSLPTELLGQAYIVSGDASFALGNTERALSDYNLAIEADATSFQPYLGLSRLALRDNDLEKALAFAKDAERYGADNTMVQYTLGLINKYTANMAEAEAYFLEAVRLFPGNMMANIELASLRINQNRIAEAEAYLDTVYAASDRQPMAIYLSAVILASRGQFEEAELFLQRVRSLTENYLPAMYIRGMVAYQLGKNEIAINSLERVLEVRPANKTVRMTLAGAYTNLQRPLAALRTLQPLLDSEQLRDTAVVSMTAAASMAAGDLERGRELYKEVADAHGNTDAPVTSDVVSKLAMAQFVSGNPEGAVATISSVSAGRGAEVRELALMASMQIRNEDLEGAEKTIEAIVETAPERSLGYNMRGTLAYKREDYAAAVTAYSEALSRKPDYYAALRNRGLAYFRLENYREAERDLKQLLSEQPNDARSKAVLGKTLLTAGKAEESVSYFKEAIRDIPNSIALSADYSQALAESGRTTQAIEQARYTARRGSGKPEVLKRMGLLLLDLDQAAAAERPLSRHVAYNPSSGNAHLLQGRALLKMGLFTGAKLSFDRAGASTSDRPGEVELDWYMFAADALAEKHDVALRRLDKLDMDRRPADISADIVGNILLSSGQPERAEEAFRAALSREQSGHVAIGLARALTEQGKDAEAVELLEDFASDQPNDRFVRSELGKRYEAAENYEGAAEQYRAILQNGVADAHTAAQLAWVYMKLNNKQSVRLVEQAYLLSPDDPYILDVHGWVLLQADRDTNKAIKSLEKAVRRSPANATYKYHLGMAYLAENRRREALRALTQAVNLDPDFDEADEARRQIALLQR